jgi:hypothetical protein
VHGFFDSGAIRHCPRPCASDCRLAAPLKLELELELELREQDVARLDARNAYLESDLICAR